MPKMLSRPGDPATGAYSCTLAAVFRYIQTLLAYNTVLKIPAKVLKFLESGKPVKRDRNFKPLRSEVGLRQYIFQSGFACVGLSSVW